MAFGFRARSKTLVEAHNVRGLLLRFAEDCVARAKEQNVPSEHLKRLQKYLRLAKRYRDAKPECGTSYVALIAKLSAIMISAHTGKLLGYFDELQWQDWRLEELLRPRFARLAA